MKLVTVLGRQIWNFSGGDPTASYIWPRWLVLRAISLVYGLIFWGVLAEGHALVGSDGIAPIAAFCQLVERVFPNEAVRFLRAPSFFLLNCSDAAIATLSWVGLASAIALLLNLWPRLSLFVCWASLLSFVATWQQFSPAIIDALMLEVGLLGIFFAPAGIRPALGESSPPRQLALLMMRWLLIRTMFGAGLIKVFAGDPHWRELTAMEAMYETSPIPTVLGYFIYHLPHAYHVAEIGFTLLTELVAPFFAVFGGRKGRAIAFGMWTVFQLGIQLTGNFGWLNTAAIALGVLLLDDQMLATAARRLRWGRLAERLRSTVGTAETMPASWLTRVSGGFLWLHFGLTLYFSAVASTGGLVPGIPDPKRRPIEYLFRDFQSANAYVPYASFPAKRFEVEFIGSDDGGRTWQSYLFRYKPQTEDRVGAFLAPRFARFESTLQASLYSNSPLIQRVAVELIEGNVDVGNLFRLNPFPDRPPEIVRMPVYEFNFTDLGTYRRTGKFWTKQYVADFAEPVTRDPAQP